MGFLSQKLPHTHFQSAVQIRDPSFAAFNQFRIVQVRIADERVCFKTHAVSPTSLVIWIRLPKLLNFATDLQLNSGNHRPRITNGLSLSEACLQGNLALSLD